MREFIDDFLLVGSGAFAAYADMHARHDGGSALVTLLCAGIALACLVAVSVRKVK
jgi:hypothetical protein